jgi:hypothetical protein
MPFRTIGFEDDQPAAPDDLPSEGDFRGRVRELLSAIENFCVNYETLAATQLFLSCN